MKKWISNRSIIVKLLVTGGASIFLITLFISCDPGGGGGGDSNDDTFNYEWTHPGNLSDNISPDGQDAANPQVAMDDNGNSIITWEQEVVSNFPKIFMSEYRNGAWAHPENLDDYISPDADLAFAHKPQVAMDNNGNAIITWYQSDGDVFQIFKSEYR